MRSPTNRLRRSTVMHAALGLAMFVGLVGIVIASQSANAADKAPSGVYQCKIFVGHVRPHDNDDKYRRRLENEINEWYAVNPDIEIVSVFQTQGGSLVDAQAVTYTVTYKRKP